MQGDDQLVGDLPIAEAARQQTRHLLLARGQWCCFARSNAERSFVRTARRERHGVVEFEHSSLSPQCDLRVQPLVEAELRRSKNGRHWFLAMFAGGVYRGRYDGTGWHAATDRKRIRHLRSYLLRQVA